MSLPELQNSPRTPAQARRGSWEGIQKRCCTFGAIFARNAFTARTPTTHRLTSYGPLLRLSVSDRRRPYGRRYLMLRWPDGLETAPRKAIAWVFIGFCPFSLRQRVPRFSNLRLRAWQKRWQIRWPVAALLIGVYFAYVWYIRHNVKGPFSSSTTMAPILRMNPPSFLTSLAHKKDMFGFYRPSAQIPA